VELWVPFLAALGGALVGVTGGYWTARSLDDRRESRRRRGLLAAVVVELMDNVVKAQSLAVNRLSSMGTFSERVWRDHQTHLAEFLPVGPYTELMNRYQELESMRTYRDDLLAGRDADCAARDLLAWSGRLVELRDELLALPEAQDVRKQWPDAEPRLERARDALEPRGGRSQ
jgi:hypothetical protein